MDALLTYVEENGAQSSGMSGFWYVLGAIGLWKMFEKAGDQGWIGFVPFYRNYKLCEKVMNDPWYWLRLFVVVFPVIGWILAIYFQYQIGRATAKAYGQTEGWAWGYTFLTPVFYVITGFGNYEYYGPFGMEDRRTEDARGARSVKFDVIEQTPVQEAEPAVQTQPAADAESEVEFDFESEPEVIE